MTKVNIFQTIKTETNAYSNKVAVVDGEYCITYGELIESARAFARDLVLKGIRDSDRVAFLCDDSADYITASLGILSIHAVIVPISTSLTRTEISLLLERMDVQYFIFDSAVYDEENSEKLEKDPFVKRSFSMIRRELINTAPEGYGEINAAFIRFSSGTTGTSKGVLLSHNTIHQRTAAAQEGLAMAPDDTVLWVLSMSFHFVVSILLFLRHAVTIVICPSPFLETIKTGLEQRRGTFIYALPFHYHLLTVSKDFSSTSLARIRMAVSTAVNLPKSTADSFFNRFGVELTGAYGIIEVGLPFIDCSGRKAGSVGRALSSFQVRIDKPDEEGIGEIVLKGKGLFDAYFSPWARRSEALDNGWFRTGDVGYLDDEGYLFIKGRAKNVINFSGMKIFPYEVESVLNQHPAISESLVEGVSHAVYGHIPSAKIVLYGNHSPDDALLRDIRRFCYKRLASYNVPKAFDFVKKLDKTASNKVVRS